mmetsp:Transcript_33927/g.77523  ORF Transcript_33927/g.77523 Transcript_33927/m.77523 type:complete len:409 (-) Transcript_33927:51-1277(-)
MLELDSTFAAVLVARSQQHMAEKRYTKALACLNDALAVEPEDVRLLALRIQLYLRLGKPCEADKDAHTILYLEPESAEGHFWRGACLSSVSRDREAWDYYNAATQLAPEVERYHNALQRCQNLIAGGVTAGEAFEAEGNSSKISTGAASPEPGSVGSSQSPAVNSQNFSEADLLTRALPMEEDVSDEDAVSPLKTVSQSTPPRSAQKNAKRSKRGQAVHRKRKPVVYPVRGSDGLPSKSPPRARSVNDFSTGRWFSEGRTCVPHLHIHHPKRQVPRPLALSHGGCPYSPEVTRGAEGIYPKVWTLPELPVSEDEKTPQSSRMRNPLDKRSISVPPRYNAEIDAVKMPHGQLPLRGKLRSTITPALAGAKAFPLDSSHDHLLEQLRTSIPRPVSAPSWPLPILSRSALR